MSNEDVPAQARQEPTRITIDLPKDLRAVYSNMAFIGHTPAEMVIDFAQVLPRSPRGTVMARVIMTPMHAKMLQIALAQNVTRYEQQYGEIRLPTQRSSIADDFFRSPHEGSEDDDNK